VLICVSALLLVVGVQYVRTEITALVRDDATLSAQKWAITWLQTTPKSLNR
jgi:hypothetical protein